MSRLTFDNYGAIVGEKSFTIDVPAPKSMYYGAADILPITGVSISSLGFTQLSAASQFFDVYQDGSPAGKLSNITVSTEGLVTAVYTNGLSKPLGTVALAKFADADRLGHFGAHSWTCREQCVTPALGRGGANLNYFSGHLGEVLGGSIEGPI